MYEEAIRIVQKYIDLCIGDCDKKILWPEKDFEVRCQSKWAAEEVLCLLKNKSMNPLPLVINGTIPEEPEEVIEQFAADMDNNGFRCENEKNRALFFIAANTTYNILAFYNIERGNY